MATEKQIAANRINATRGGVRTPEGKAVSRFNAMRHGFLSTSVLLHGEDPQELEELLKSMHKDYKQKSVIKSPLIDRIVSSFWRLRRLIATDMK